MLPEKPATARQAKSGNQQQVFLYAYRSLAKELFDKENVLTLLVDMLEDVKDNIGLSKYISSLIDGTKNSLNSLNVHKKIYDEILNNETYDDMRCVSFNSTDKLFMAFSNILYPEFDFMGNIIRDLSNTNTDNIFDLITFCSVPTKNGWSFIFSWHKSVKKLFS